MAQKKSKDDIIRLQGSIIKEWQDKYYTILTTGEIPKISTNTKKSRSFKHFLKNSEDVDKIVENKTSDIKAKMKKMEKIVKKNNLDRSLHITGMRYIRIATYMDNIEDLLHDIISCKDECYTLPNGFKVRSGSLRYQTFNKSLTCAKCGLKGRFLALERCLSDEGGHEGKREGQGFHLNLYALDDMGREVLMTKDHILPKSKGGPDHIDNLQTMCTYCNSDKGNIIPDDIPEELIKPNSRAA